MQVQIENLIFNKSSNFADLDSLFSLFRDEQHQWLIIDIEELQKTDWYAELNFRDKRLINNFAVASVRRIRNKKIINISENGGDVEFNLKEAYIFLRQALIVLVENSEFEPHFLNAIFDNFDHSGEINHAKQMQWLRFSNGGGANDNAITGEIQQSFNHPFLTKPKSTYLRYFVIKDSDKKYLDEVISQSKTRFLIQNNIPHHILYKREKENYVPDEVFKKYESIRAATDYIGAYLRLNEHQKDFLDIELGFSRKSEGERVLIDRNELDVELKEFYRRISNDDYKVLGMGFSGKYPKSIKADFSKEFNKLTKTEMFGRIRHQELYESLFDGIKRNEFEHIIHEIKRLL